MAKYNLLSKGHVSKWTDMFHVSVVQQIINNNFLKPNYYYINFISWDDKKLIKKIIYFVDNDTDQIH